ncbi:hypothetical protein [Streptomyces sp. NPDC048385]|uniref:hypothetical protein n=1 Tax=unclassified Streptomyces TaxID=2593676 RepID=UPI00343FE79F
MQEQVAVLDSGDGVVNLVEFGVRLAGVVEGLRIGDGDGGAELMELLGDGESACRPETPGERDYYLGWGPEDTPVEDLVLVPGARWRVEEAIKLAKSAAGMADYEVRHFHGWYRHITLSQLAAAFLAVRAAAERGGGQDTEPHTGGPE